MPATPRYVFFLSYARDDGDAYLDRFYGDLVEMLRLKTGRSRDEIGFRDTQKINLGAQWKSALSEALSSCQCFIPLYSPTYFNREYCGKEWSAFWKRIQHQENTDSFHPLILPILWTPPGARFEKLSEDIRSIQNVFPQLGTNYSKKGLRHLLFLDKEKDNYREFLTIFSDIVLEAINEHSLEPTAPALQIEAFPNAFEETPPPPTRYQLPQTFIGPTDPDLRARDFLTRVEKICRLHEPDADVERIHGSGLIVDHLRVSVRSGEIVRMYPVAALEQGVTPESFESFLTDIDAWYRRADTGLISYLVYGGAPAPAALLREAVTQRVRLQSFVEYQGLIDFRSYIERQTVKLATDKIYPPRLYVPQRMSFRLGQEEHESRDALDTIREWLTTPNGRFALILGDFGTGKTFLLHELARQMGETDAGVIPILLQMRSLEKGRSLDALLAQHFAMEGMEGFSPSKFRYMLEEGRIALLFDGFDELAIRVTYPKATEHFTTLLDAANGAAKVVVTSRRQHFMTDQQVLTVLGERVEMISGHRIGVLQPFDREQIHRFLVNFCGEPKQAEARLRLIDRVKDLLGLSENPRMLGFIADLPEEQLEAVSRGVGEITAAGLYKLLLDRWLGHEFERVHPTGAAPGLSIADRWRAVTALAIRLWQKTEPSVSLDELSEDTAKIIDAIERASLDPAAATFQIGSGTLLVHDGEGNFSFLHQSILEWLVARKAAEEIVSNETCDLLNVRELSLLMIDFLTSLAGRQTVASWAQEAATSSTGDIAARNALALLSRLGEELRRRADFTGQDLRGKDLSGQDFTEAILDGADLSAAKLVKTRLSRARLVEAKLADADLSDSLLDGADLTRANLSRARLLGTDLTESIANDSIFRRAKLIGARGIDITGCDAFGSAISTSTLRAYLKYPRSSSQAIAWSPDGEIIASAEGSQILIWEASSGREILALGRHGGWISSLAFNPDGKLLASASHDQTIRIWNIDSNHRDQVLDGHEGWITSIAFSPDGKLLASTSHDLTIRVWEVASGKQNQVFQGHSNWIYCIAFSPDGRILASGSYDKTVRLWRIGSGNGCQTLKGHQGSVSSLAFSPDGETLASGSSAAIHLWDVATGKERDRIQSGHRNSITRVAFSPDGDLLASASYDSSIKIWQAQSRKLNTTFDGHSGAVTSISFSPDSKSLASSSLDKTVILWHFTKTDLRHLKREEQLITQVVFSPDGTFLASTTEREIHLWEVTTGNRLNTFSSGKPILSAAFGPKNKELLGSSQDSILSYGQTGVQLMHLASASYFTGNLALSSDGTAFASGSTDHEIYLGQMSQPGVTRILRGHTGTVRSVAFSPNGQRLASGSEDRSVRVWGMGKSDDVQIFQGHQKPVLSVAFSPDGKTLASGSEDKTLRLWQVDSGREIRALKGRYSVLSVAFSPDGKTLASGSEDKTLRLWQVDSGREIRALKGHDHSVLSVSFSPNGKSLASSSADNTIRLWEVATGRCICILSPLPEGWVAFSPDGRYKYGGVPAGGFWHAINLCRFEAGELDDYVPGLRLADDASFFDLPPTPWVSGHQG